MITSERELENFLEKNIAKVIEQIKETFKITRPIAYIGRQVNVGKGNRLDMLFSYDIEDADPFGSVARNYIVVELKFRPLCAEDYKQLARYMDAVYVAAEYAEDDIAAWSVYGLLVGSGFNHSFADIHSHVIDHNRIKVWYMNDYMEEAEINQYDIAGYTEVEETDVDERFKKNINCFVANDGE